MTSPHDDAPATTAAAAGPDSLDLARAVADLPEQLEAALASSEATQGAADVGRIANVAVMGMGGSGVAGDIVSALAAPLMPVPVNLQSEDLGKMNASVAPATRKAKIIPTVTSCR